MNASASNELASIDRGGRKVSHKFLGRHPYALPVYGIINQGIDSPFGWHRDMVSELVIEGVRGIIQLMTYK